MTQHVGDGVTAASTQGRSGVKPRLSQAQIFNMSFGFMGIQVGFALQNANTSRIFQSLGADIDTLPLLWMAAPLTGFLVQPIVGYLSDRTWGPLGRRKPYFLVGALLAAAAMVFMPNAPVLAAAAAGLWLMDAAINVSMEPFRAFVGDLLPNDQRTAGYAAQSVFIGVGAVVASAMPWILGHVFHVRDTGAGVPDAVRLAYYIGAVALLGCVAWTVVSTREYSPDEAAAFTEAVAATPPAPASRTFLIVGVPCLIVAAAVALWLHAAGADLGPQLLAGLVAAFGAALLVAWLLRRGGRGGGYVEILDDLFRMPKAMRRLAVAQFFTWFALFAMWIYATPAVTARHYHAGPGSAGYDAGADWVGVLMAAYNGVAAVAAFALPALARRLGRPRAHALCLMLGGLGLLSFPLISDPRWLAVSMVGVGVAWASILSTPYSILSSAAPAHKLGVYMGIFNITIVTPQLLAATILGLILKTFFGGQAIWALALGGVAFLAAAIAALAVEDQVGASQGRAP
jgi:maltose/moltooligosaccharide transporter